MALFKIYFILFFVTSSSSLCFARQFTDPAIDSLLKNGIINILNQDYDKAEENFSILNRVYPEIPLGKIYLAANMIAESFDYETEFNDELIRRHLNDAIEESELLLQEDEDNIWNIYYFALSKGYYAYFQALNKNWLSAVSNGFDSYRSFRKCLDIDSTFYDAYIAIGSFKYWKSKKTEFLAWLPFFADESEAGIKYLLKSLENPSYNTYLGIYSLQWIYIDESKFEEAVKLSKSVLNDYPGSRFFKWGLARAYEGIDRNVSIKLYWEILESYANKKNVYLEILIKHLIAQQYEKSGKFEKALNLCDEILNIINIPDLTDGKIKERIERVKKQRNNLLEKTGEVKVQ